MLAALQAQRAEEGSEPDLNPIGSTEAAFARPDSPLPIRDPGGRALLILGGARGGGLPSPVSERSELLSDPIGT